LRLIAFILSLYILLLNGVPCCAFDNCEDELEAISHPHNVQQENKENKKECSTCSPFFCHTCSGFVISTFNFTHKVFLSTPTTVYQPYYDPFYSQFMPSYWQPPDVV
jgi:hypothetical protein